jgi:hypothetical protein
MRARYEPPSGLPRWRCSCSTLVALTVARIWTITLLLTVLVIAGIEVLGSTAQREARA